MIPKLAIERVDGEPVIGSGLEEQIVAAGFSRQPRRLVAAGSRSRMPEGDTIHRAARRGSTRRSQGASSRWPRRRTRARRFTAAPASCVGRTARARPRRAASTCSCTSPSGLVLHSHLGMNGTLVDHRRWPAALRRGRWLAPGCGPRGSHAQTGGKVLRLVQRVASSQRPGPAPARPRPAGARASTAPRRCRATARRSGAGRELGDALLDQRMIAGIGNAIRNEALLRGRDRARGASVDELERRRARRWSSPRPSA